MSSIQNDEEQTAQLSYPAVVQTSERPDVTDPMYCKEMEYLVQVCFISATRTQEEFQAAMCKLEEFYLPDSPAERTVPMLICIYLKTASSEVQLSITQRLTFYILQRWQCLDKHTVSALEAFLDQSINNLSFGLLLAAESAKNTSSLLRVLTSLMVTYYGELQLVDGVLNEMRKFVTEDKYATVALGLSVLESFLDCLVSQVNSPQKRFTQNVAKSQMGKHAIWAICAESLKITEQAHSSVDLAELPPGCTRSKLNLIITPNNMGRLCDHDYLDKQLVLKLISVLALAARLNRPPHRDADDFWDEPGQLPSISTMPTNYRSALSFYKALPQHLPALWKLVTMFKPEEELYIKFFEVFRFVAGFSLYLYRDRNLDLSLPNTYHTLFSVLGDILNPEMMILARVREFAPSDLADCLAASVPEQVIPGKVFKELPRFHEVINNAYHHTVDRFRGASSARGMAPQEAAALYRFWSRVQHLQTRAAEAYTPHAAQVLDIQEKSLQCFENICKLLTKPEAGMEPDEAIEVLCKLGKSLYGLYEHDISKFIFVVQNVITSTNLGFSDSVTALLLFLIISENLSPRLIERTENSHIRRAFAELAPRAVDVLFERMSNLNGMPESTTTVFFRMLGIRMVSSLLLDWIAPQSWDFVEFKADFASNFSTRFPTNSQMDYKYFLIRIVASEEFIRKDTLEGYLQMLKKISDVSRLEKQNNPPRIAFMLGKAEFRLEDILSLQLSHEGDLNYHLSLDLATGKNLYSKLSRLSCLCDNLYVSNCKLQQSTLTEPPEDESPFMSFLKPLLTYVITGGEQLQFGEPTLELRQKLYWGLVVLEGIILGVANGSCMTRLFQLFHEHKIYLRINTLVQRLDDAVALNLGLGAISALAKKGKDLRVEDEQMVHFLETSSQLMILILKTLGKLVLTLDNAKPVDYFERFLEPLSKTCNVVSSLLETSSAQVSAKGSAMADLILQVVSGIQPTKISACIEHSRELFDFLMVFVRLPLFDLPVLDGEKASLRCQEILNSRAKKASAGTKANQQNIQPATIFTQSGCKIFEYPEVLTLFAAALEASDHCIRSTALLSLTSLFSRGITPFVIMCRQNSNPDPVKAKLLAVWNILKDLATRVYTELQLVCGGTRSSDSLGGTGWITCLYWSVAGLVFLTKSELEMQGSKLERDAAWRQLVPQIGELAKINPEMADLILEVAQTGWGAPKLAPANLPERMHQILGTTTVTAQKPEKLDEEY